MNRSAKNSRVFAALLTFLFLIPSVFGLYPRTCFGQQAEADRIKSVKFLTINLLFFEVDDRNKRLRKIADYLAANQVDVILLQEVVGGELVNTRNSALDLKDLLREEHDLRYFSRTSFETGVPNLLNVGNAILSRFEIESSDDRRLPRVTEAEFQGFDVQLARSVLMVRLLIPGFGEVDVFNTHLCARCSLSDREDQLDEVIDFFKRFQNDAGAPRPTLLGGDMNFDLFDNNGDERFLYDKILVEGFSDAYARYIIAAAGGQETLETLCDDEDNADEHCTVGVSNLNGDNARRIDYLFEQGFGPPVQGLVAFNPKAPNGMPPTVSDHAAVVVKLHLPFQGTLPHVPLLLLEKNQK